MKTTTEAAREWGMGEASVKDAIADGLLWPVPASPRDDSPLYLDGVLARALGLPVEGSLGSAPEVLGPRVEVLRAGVRALMHGHDIPELHRLLPFAVNSRGEPSGLRFVAAIRQEGVLWLTSIRSPDPQPLAPDGLRVGARGPLPTMSLEP